MINVKIGRNIVDEIKDNSLEQRILEFVRAKEIVDEHTKFLKSLKEDIEKKARNITKDKKEATVTLVIDEVAVKVSFGWNTTISNKEKLTELLGDRFNDLVDIKTSYAPTKRLTEMMLNDDGLKECLSIKEKTPTVAVVKA